LRFSTYGKIKVTLERLLRRQKHKIPVFFALVSQYLDDQNFDLSARNDFAERLKIFAEYSSENNFVEILKIMRQCCKKF